ncbi:Protein turtle [Frankliniella fusca]|uniref:Protein turtle n=1 Tax=Frankliniella fusca TaxID=407009 RepID=A0AAE1LK51_9NEOP|nr:Protein turtle [Frankliniella fusca]
MISGVEAPSSKVQPGNDAVNTHSLVSSQLDAVIKFSELRETNFALQLKGWRENMENFCGSKPPEGGCGSRQAQGFYPLWQPTASVFHGNRRFADCDPIAQFDRFDPRTTIGLPLEVRAVSRALDFLIPVSEALPQRGTRDSNPQPRVPTRSQNRKRPNAQSHRANGVVEWSLARPAPLSSTRTAASLLTWSGSLLSPPVGYTLGAASWYPYASPCEASANCEFNISLYPPPSTNTKCWRPGSDYGNTGMGLRANPVVTCRQLLTLAALPLSLLLGAIVPALSFQDAQHITAILGESVVFNCNVDFPEDHPVPYVLQWEKKP